MSILNPNKKQVMWIIHCMLDQVHFGKEALKNLNGWQLLFKLIKLWKNTQHGFRIDTLKPLTDRNLTTDKLPGLREQRTLSSIVYSNPSKSRF